MTEAEIEEFRQQHHTYLYTGVGGAPASSRIDRWYADARSRDWVMGVDVRSAACHSDDEGVVPRLADSSVSGWIRRQKKAYLPTPLQTRWVGEVCTRLLYEAPAPDGEAAIDGWDSLKTVIRVTCLR